MTANEFYIILNPHADRGHAAKVGSRLLDMLDTVGVRWTMSRTAGPGDATALAAEAARTGWPAVVVVGGDGTINEVVNGLLRAGDDTDVPLLGIVPAGSGNDFVKVLGIGARNVADAVEHLLHGTVRRVDVGRVDRRYFINGVGWGFDGMVAVEAQKIRHLRGFLLYAFALLKVLFKYRAAPVRLSIDGHIVTDDVVMVAITNGACHGGGFWICPHADVDDGRLDVCVADAMAPLPLLRLALQVIRGAHVGNPRVWFERGSVVRLQSTVPMPAHMDGEILGTGLTDLHVEVVPRRLRVLV